MFVDQLKIEGYYEENVPQMTSNMAISYFSGASFACVGFFLLWNRKFKDHPYWMLAYSCLSISII